MKRLLADWQTPQLSHLLSTSIPETQFEWKLIHLYLSLFIVDLLK